MMLRSKKVVGNIRAVAVRKRMARNRNISRKSISEVHIERKSTRKRSSSVLHCGTDSCQALANCDCISGVGQSSSVAEQYTRSQGKKSPAEAEKFCSAASLISTSSFQVLPASLISTSSFQVLPNSNQTVGIQSSSTTEDPVKSHVMEEDSFEVVSIEISDVSELKTTAQQPSSNRRTPDAETSDIIVIPDSPREASFGNSGLKSTLSEVSQLPNSRKRKNSDESGVEILCDISGSRSVKQRKIESDNKEKKFWTNTIFKENVIVTVIDTDRKVSEHTKNENRGDVIRIGDRNNEDGDDIIFIGADDDDDDDVSVITPKKEHKPPQEDVIILDSRPMETPLQIVEQKPKKMVSASTSVTGLIPHYSRHLIDFIPLGGKPPATISGFSTGTPVLPAADRGRKVMRKQHKEFDVPAGKRYWSPKTTKQWRKGKAAQQNRLLNARNREPAAPSNCVNVSNPPPRLLANQFSEIRNPTPSFTDQNLANQYFTCQNSEAQNSAAQNSAAQNSAAQNSAAQNSAAQNSAAQNSATKNLAHQNSASQNSTTQNSPPQNLAHSAPEVSQSPACAYGTNIYNPNASEKQECGLRPVIIDGNNIAMGHGKGKCFSWRGLHICIKYFLKRGHKVTAFVPTFRRGVCPPELRSEMEEYEKSGQVVFTPSRRVDGRLIVAYDDRFIVQCAAELGGVIVSTDNFRDLLSENSSWKETIEKRLLMFTWVGDLLMFPNDPLGRNGPKFEDFLRFPV